MNLRAAALHATPTPPGRQSHAAAVHRCQSQVTLYTCQNYSKPNQTKRSKLSWAVIEKGVCSVLPIVLHIGGVQTAGRLWRVCGKRTLCLRVCGKRRLCMRVCEWRVAWFAGVGESVDTKR